jgi:hypothetical protein
MLHGTRFHDIFLAHAEYFSPDCRANTHQVHMTKPAGETSVQKRQENTWK